MVSLAYQEQLAMENTKIGFVHNHKLEDLVAVLIEW